MNQYLKMPWSIEDTIENLRELKEVLQNKVRVQNLHGRGELDSEEVAFDFDRAIEALEKQIPKKPIGKVDKACTCGLVIQVKNKRNCLHFCHNCGQRIDWSVEE